MMNQRQVENLKELKDKFDNFIFEMSDSLEALQADVDKLGRPELLPLDYSFESLGRLEKMYALVLDGEVPSTTDQDILATRLARYLGQTLKKQVGGKWDFCKNPQDINYGKPCVTQIPGLPKTYCFYPLVVVAGYRSSRRPGWMRKMVERNDIEHLRSAFARFLEKMDTELEALNSYVKSLSLPELLPLDYTFESLDRVEQLLSLVLNKKIEPPTGGIERLIEQVTRYMGTVYQQHVGGEWQLCEDPRNIDFGLPRLGFYCPAEIVENYRVHRLGGLLRNATEQSASPGSQL